MKKYILMLALTAFAGGLSAQSTTETTKAPAKEDAVKVDKVHSCAGKAEGKEKGACCAGKAQANGKVAEEGKAGGCCAGKGKAEGAKSCHGEEGKASAKGACCASKAKADAKAPATKKVAEAAPVAE